MPTFFETQGQAYQPEHFNSRFIVGRDKAIRLHDE